MFRETQALSELTEAYAAELTQASGGLGRNAVYVMNNAKNTLEGITFGVATRDNQTVSIGEIKRTLTLTLNTLKQSREDLLSIQTKTSDDKEEITLGQDGIKVVHEKTSTVVNVLEAQKDVPSTGTQVAASAIENGERYIARIRKR